MRPILKPALPLWWRDDVTVQFGLGDSAPVLTGLGPEQRAVLALLDGSRTRRAVLTGAAALGLPSDATGDLLDVLLEAGVLDDVGAPDPLSDLEPRERRRLSVERSALATRTRTPGAAAAALRRRRRAVLVVEGETRLGALVAALLAAGGIGLLDVRLEGSVEAGDALPGGCLPSDVGRGGREVGADVVARACGAGRTGPVARADLVVSAGAAAAARPPVDGSGFPVPHLAVMTSAHESVVGPLVLPGRPPCLRCVDLARRDRDRAGAAARTAGIAGLPADAASTVTAAGFAAQIALGFLDDGAAVLPPGATIELRPPTLHPRGRTWGAHPECGCEAS